MRLLIATLLTFACLATPVLAADLRYVHLDRIEHIDKYWDQVQFVLNNQHYFQGFIPDEQWNAPFSREKYGERLMELYQTLLSLPEESNQDYLLLRAMVSDFLYQLEVDYLSYETTVKHYEEIHSLPDRDYRYLWMLGLFNAKAVRPYDSVEQFEYVVSRIDEDLLHPDFWRDYGYAAALAFMPQTALQMYDRFFRSSGEDPSGFSIYASLSDKLVEPDLSESIPGDRMSRLLTRESGSGLLIRPLGLWLPVDLDWRLPLIGIQNRLSTVFFQPDSVVDDHGRRVTYTIAVFTFLNDESVAQDFLQSFKEVSPVEYLDDDRYTLYDYSDDSLYHELGGSRGRILVVQSPIPSSPGIAIERPSMLPLIDLPVSDTGMTYVPFQEEILRVREHLTHVVFLDCGYSIYDQALPVYMDFVDRLIVE